MCGFATTGAEQEQHVGENAAAKEDDGEQRGAHAAQPPRCSRLELARARERKVDARAPQQQSKRADSAAARCSSTKALISVKASANARLHERAIWAAPPVSAATAWCFAAAVPPTIRPTTRPKAQPRAARTARERPAGGGDSSVSMPAPQFSRKLGCECRAVKRSRREEGAHDLIAAITRRRRRDPCHATADHTHSRALRAPLRLLCRRLAPVTFHFSTRRC